MAAELKKNFEVDVTLIPGSGGIFDVHLDGALVFSKLGDDGHFPEPGEVTSVIQKL
ncbi:MAG: hypothetical protein COA70_01925 [Planctomycetota bacterium]|nr:MAG: hypothetical protein COA70_01925 [Planctomycetota bacterium]